MKSLRTVYIILAIAVVTAIAVHQGAMNYDFSTIAELLAVNFLPWIIAAYRDHNAKLAIFWTLIITDCFTLLAVPATLIGGIGVLIGGLMVIVWFACLIWSLNGNTRRADRRRAELIAEAIAASQARTS